MIAERCIPESVEVIASNKTGEWQLRWSSSWLPGVLRTCKKLSAILGPIIPQRVSAVIDSDYRSEILSRYSERPILNPRFPRAVLQHAKELNVVRRHFAGLYPCERIEVTRFQNLKKVAFDLGQVPDIIMKCVAWGETLERPLECDTRVTLCSRIIAVMVSILTYGEIAGLRRFLVAGSGYLSAVEKEIARLLALVLADQDRCAGAVDKFVEELTDIHRHQLLGLPNDAVVEIQCQFNDENDQVSYE